MDWVLEYHSLILCWYLLLKGIIMKQKSMDFVSVVISSPEEQQGGCGLGVSGFRS